MIRAIATVATNLQRIRERSRSVLFGAPSSWPSLFEETRDMLEVAALIYHFAELRRLHRDGDIKVDDDRMVVDTMKEPLEARDLYDFFSKNEEALREKLGDEKYTLVNEILTRKRECETSSEAQCPNPQLLIFDDSNGTKELVYGITVNHSQKRIVVVFRGSVTLNDFITDARIRQTYIPNPVKASNQPSKIALHTGFKEYLFGDDGGTSTKCNKIVKEVKELLQRHPGYRLYVTGHSLGAALATLFAFHIAASSNDIGIDGPVTCIPIASPKVGDMSFQAAFQGLEDRGWIRLVRVENNLDLVTMVPNPYTFRFLAVFSPSRMYRHVGMSIKLYKNQPYSIAGSYVYRKMETVRNILTHMFMLWWTVASLIVKRTDFFDNHSCDEYLERLTEERNKESLEQLAMNNLLIKFKSSVASSSSQRALLNQ